MDLAVIAGEMTGRRVLAEIKHDKCKVLNSIMALSDDQQDTIAAIMDLWVEEGERGVAQGTWGYLKKKGKPKVEEWKPDKHTRLHWYGDGGDIIVFHVTGKNQQKARKEDIARGVKFAKAYLDAKCRGQIEIIPPGD